MNERKWNRIIESVRAEPPPAVPGDFDLEVMRRIRGERQPRAASLTDQLNALFPKLAWAAAAMIALCVAGDFLLTAGELPDLTEGVARISDQWLIPAEGI